MSVRYVPARSDGWLLIAAGTSALLCKLDDTQTAAFLWDAIRSSDPTRACLDVLTQKGLGSAPSFALATWSGDPETDAVVLARGEASATVTNTEGVSRLDGASVSTWIEKRFDNVTALVLGELVASEDTLPLEAGVVFATSAELGAGSVTSTATSTSAGTAIAGELAAVAPVPAASPLKPSVVAPVPTPETITSIPESTITELGDHAVPADGYAHLFEETVVRKIEDAAVRPPEETQTDDEPATLDGDHDGLTVMSGDLAALRLGRRPASGPTPVRVAHPAIKYFLELSTGGREPLVQSALVGRSPSARKVSSGQVPRLIAIPGDQDISRNHAQFVLEGGTVVVTDLHSRNGTSVILPGKAPQALRAGEPTPVIPGTIVDLGGGVRLTVIEEIP